MKALDDVDIRMAVFREQTETLEDADENALAESKLGHMVGLYLGKERVQKPMELLPRM